MGGAGSLVEAQLMARLLLVALVSAIFGTAGALFSSWWFNHQRIPALEYTTNDGMRHAISDGYIAAGPISIGAFSSSVIQRVATNDERTYGHEMLESHTDGKGLGCDLDGASKSGAIVRITDTNGILACSIHGGH